MVSTRQEYPDNSALTPSGKDQQDAKMLEVDGNRPIDTSDLQVQKVLPIDGNRPVVSDNVSVRDTIEVDGSRPIAASSLEA